MTTDHSQSDALLTLIVRQRIDADAEWLFDAWTTPAQLMAWWGPTDVTCIVAEVDLRVGGSYSFGNRFGDGKVVWIEGEFEEITRPTRLVYTWRVGSQAASERVTVCFDEHDESTEVIVLHERIGSTAAREGHALGWRDCLDGLTEFRARRLR